MEFIWLFLFWVTMKSMFIEWEELFVVIFIQKEKSQEFFICTINYWREDVGSLK